VYVVFALGCCDTAPLALAVPGQYCDPPDAVQYVELVLDHVSMVDWPAIIVVGFAESVTTGAAPITETGALEATAKLKFCET
jgi:hypothetical protein